MTDEKLQLLVIEDDDDDFLLVRDLLTAGLDCQVERAASAEEALARADRAPFDALLLDYRLGAASGLDLLRTLRQRDVAAPVIFLTGQGDEQVAVEAMKAGATDYLAKSKLTQPALLRALHYALHLRRQQDATLAARRALQASEQRFRALVENSSDVIALLAADATLLYVSHSVERILGYRPDELIDTDSLALVHPQDRPRVQALLQALLRSPGMALRDEHRTRHKDDRYLVMECMVTNRLADDSVAAIVLNSRDISERYQAEEALRQSERDYRTLFENANDAIMIFEPQQEIILEVNPKACQMYGFSRLELLGKSLQELSLDVEHGRQGIAHCLAHGELRDFDTTHRRRDGSPIYIVANASLIDYRGQQAILTLSHDVSERRAAQQEIFRLNRALKALSKCNQALLHASDRQQLLQEICQIVVEFGGYPLAWVGVPRPEAPHLPQPLTSAGDRHAYLAALSSKSAAELNHLPPVVALRTGQTVVCRDIHNDDRYRALRQEWAKHGYVSMIALPLNLESRRFGVFAIYACENDAFDAAEVELLSELANNVSFGLTALHAQAERARAEEELRDSEHRLRHLIETANEGIWTIDDQERTTFVNRKMADLLGYTPEEMLGIEVFQFMPPEQATRAQASVRQRSNALGRYETVLLRKDGAQICVDLNSSPLLDANGNYRGALAMISDITERRNLQAQLLHSQKLEAVGQLAGGVAHDFNNLLMLIGSHAELLAGLTADPPARRKAEEILEAVRRGASLTRQLLAFSRKQVLSPRVLDLNDTLAQLGPTLPRMLGEKIIVQLQPAAGLWAVRADPAQIEQVLLNLALNARDAMPQGGRLTLETANVELSPDYARTHAGVLPGLYVMLAVSDSGQGIPHDVLPHIFEPFFTTKARGRGSGLGLSTVYGIVQQSGGFVWVYSELDQGTVFKIYLPKVDTPVALSASPAGDLQRQRETETATPTHTPLATILLVEDEEAVRAAVAEFLSARGYRVLQAATGQQALALAAGFSGSIHLVISDVVMPGISGSDMARQLLALRPHTRVLFVSGYTQSTVGEHGLGPGADFLQKPFSLAALAARIRDLLAGQSQLASSK